MEHYKTVDIPAVPATTKQVLDSVSCDLCKAKIRSNGMFSVNDIIVSCEIGCSYPDGSGSTSEWEYDICEDCFKTKLMVWLESQGAIPRFKEKSS